MKKKRLLLSKYGNLLIKYVLRIKCNEFTTSYRGFNLKKLKKITHKNSQKLTKLFVDAKNMAIKESKPMATRKSSEDILNLLTVHIPELIGGSADLAGSNNTKTKSQKIMKK